MTNSEIIDQLRTSTFIDEDGETYELDFQEGLTAEELTALSKLFPNHTIDKELIELLSLTRGWEGYGLEQVDFSSIGQFGFLELAPHSVTLGHDGFGNFWILDILDDGSLGHVYYACHDPAVLVKYADDLNSYLQSLLAFYRSPGANYLNEVHDQVVFDIWSSGGKILEKRVFREENKAFDLFLNEFEGDDWMVADLREAKDKEGFAWGKFGPNNLTRRHPDELIWIIKKKKKGFFARLFGN